MDQGGHRILSKRVEKTGKMALKELERKRLIKITDNDEIVLNERSFKVISKNISDAVGLSIGEDDTEIDLDDCIKNGIELSLLERGITNKKILHLTTEAYIGVLKTYEAYDEIKSSISKILIKSHINKRWKYEKRELSNSDDYGTNDSFQ